MRIEATHIDPATGEPDHHGIPQISCPARQDDVNPQFTCQNCPCAGQLDTHEAVDDRGQAFHIVDAVECTFDGAARTLAAFWQRFPSLLEGIVENASPRDEPGVPCPLLGAPERRATVWAEVDGVRWVPTGNCLNCQFYRGAEGDRLSGSPGVAAGLGVVCAGPVMRRVSDERESPQ